MWSKTWRNGKIVLLWLISYESWKMTPYLSRKWRHEYWVNKLNQSIHVVALKSDLKEKMFSSLPPPRDIFRMFFFQNGTLQAMIFHMSHDSWYMTHEISQFEQAPNFSFLERKTLGPPTQIAYKNFWTYVGYSLEHSASIETIFRKIQ